VDDVCGTGSNPGFQIDSGGNLGTHTSITVGSDGFAVISYRLEGSGGVLRIGHCINLQCDEITAQRVDTSATAPGTYTAVAIGVDGFPLVAYGLATLGDLRVMHCSNVFGTPYFRRR
jgi:hypothetical protein